MSITLFLTLYYSYFYSFGNKIWCKDTKLFAIRQYFYLKNLEIKL